jgi:hypothetical protein
MWFSNFQLALTLLTSGSRSVGIIRSRTQVTEFSLVYNITIFQVHFSNAKVFIFNFAILYQPLSFSAHFTRLGGAVRGNEVNIF